MFYAILAYHAEGEVESWTPQEDAALMTDLLAVHDKLVADGRMGPAARLGPTLDARTQVASSSCIGVAMQRTT